MKICLRTRSLTLAYLRLEVKFLSQPILTDLSFVKLYQFKKISDKRKNHFKLISSELFSSFSKRM